MLWLPLKLIKLSRGRSVGRLITYPPVIWYHGRFPRQIHAAIKITTTAAVLWIRNWRMLLHIPCVQSPDGSTFMHEMKSWLPSWKYGVTCEIRLRQLMRTYLKNNSAKFHPDPINDRALGLLKRSPTTRRRRTRTWSARWVAICSGVDIQGA